MALTMIYQNFGLQVHNKRLENCIGMIQRYRGYRGVDHVSFFFLSGGRAESKTEEAQLDRVPGS